MIDRKYWAETRLVEMAGDSPPFPSYSDIRNRFALDMRMHASLFNIRFLQPEFKNPRNYFPEANYLTNRSVLSFWM